MSHELSKNALLRKQKKISRSTIEAILAKVFPVVLNLEALPPEDMLHVLSRKDIVQRWAEVGGFEGQRAIKEKVIKVILNQLIPTDRASSSSFILFGESSTGKTFLFQSLAKTLGLKEYKINASPQENAGAGIFILNMAKLQENGEGQGPGNISVEQALKNIDYFLSLDTGNRGILVLDDLHVAPSKVRSIFVRKLRSFLESPTYPATGPTEQVTVIPTRNVVAVVTMNATPDNKKIEKITGANGRTPSLEQLILATLSPDDEIWDDSFLKRFATIINMNTFPPDAKSPNLAKKVVDGSKQAFVNSGILTFVSSYVIEKLVEKFPNEGARTFTPAAVSSLIKIRTEGGKAVIVVPKLVVRDSPLINNTSAPGGGSLDVAEQMERFIEQNLERVPIDSSMRGKIEIMRYLLDGVRKYTFETLLKTIAESESFSGDVNRQQNRGAPSARALVDHLKGLPVYPLEYLPMDATAFGASSAVEKGKFKQIVHALIQRQSVQMKSYPKVGVPQAERLIEEFQASGILPTNKKTRQHVLKETIDSLSENLDQVASTLFRVSDIRRLPDSEKWIDGLTKDEPVLIKKFGSALNTEMIKYLTDVFNPGLVESQNESKEKLTRLSEYDAMRLFALAVDRALARLPWGALTQFASRSLTFVTEDATAGQRVGVQHVFFESKTSPFISPDLTVVTGNAQSVPFFDTYETGANRVVTPAVRFDENCGVFLNLIMSGGGFVPRGR
ncbi:MAG: hypothetical protein SGI74_14730 [Oligoflexia bacterium]|nr:hypothetical protein [Oligoflexia bacterium]